MWATLTWISEELSLANPTISEVPDLMKIWDFERNLALGNDPGKITTGTHKKLWFTCTTYVDHSFLTAPLYILDGQGCGVCAGRQVWRGFNDFESQCPYESYFWDYSKNGENPWEVAKSKNKKYWFLCEEGHPFFSSLGNISYKGMWCPYCAGTSVIPGVNDLQTLYPQLAGQLDPVGNIDPTSLSPSSHKKVGWICTEDETHRWQAVVNNRTRKGYGCPQCSKSIIRSKAEIQIFSWIANDLLPGVEVVPNDKYTLGGKHIDIYIPSLKLGFEYNGNYWHKDKGDPDGPSAQKERLAREKGVTLYTIWEDDWTSDRSTWEEFIVRAINLTQK